MINNFRQKLNRLSKLYRYFSTLQKAGQSRGVAKREYLQFSKARLTDFGELPQGQIPSALEYDRPFKLSQLSNGVRVGTETWTSPIASITVQVKAGTRQETLETSGVCQFITRLQQSGTQKRTKDQVQSDIDNFGGSFKVKVGRETTTYTLSFLPEQQEQAVEFLGDVLLNSIYSQAQIEAERDLIYKQSVETHRDQFQATIEAVHYTSFRDHFISQPIKGIRENIANVNEDHIRNYIAANYFGNNFVVVGAGPIEHEKLSAQVDKAFGGLQKTSSVERANTETPFFTPSKMYMRDDEMHNLNIGVFFNAPSWNDPDFFALQLLQNVLGEYRIDKNGYSHLNNADRQYNTLHTELAQFPDVTIHKAKYYPYSDSGLFGSYIHGNEVFGENMLYVTQYVLTDFASNLGQTEVYRARNNLYNQLLSDNSTEYVANIIATQVNYTGRRIPRSEFARRLSHYDSGLLERVVTRWFWDRDISAVVWGPCHHMMPYSGYNRPTRRSTLGFYGASMYRVV